MPIVYRFPNEVLVQVWTEKRRVQTWLPNGLCVDAVPWDDDDEYRQRAVDHGYGGSDPCWDLCRDHEIGHTFLAWSLRDEVSLALWMAAHHVAGEALAHPALWREEADVLAFQTKLNRRRFSPRPWQRFLVPATITP